MTFATKLKKNEEVLAAENLTKGKFYMESGDEL